MDHKAQSNISYSVDYGRMDKIECMVPCNVLMNSIDNTLFESSARMEAFLALEIHMESTSSLDGTLIYKERNAHILSSYCTGARRANIIRNKFAYRR